MILNIKVQETKIEKLFKELSKQIIKVKGAKNVF